MPFLPLDEDECQNSKFSSKGLPALPIRFLASANKRLSYFAQPESKYQLWEACDIKLAGWAFYENLRRLTILLNIYDIQ